MRVSEYWNESRFIPSYYFSLPNSTTMRAALRYMNDLSETYRNIRYFAVSEEEFQEVWKEIIRAQPARMSEMPDHDWSGLDPAAELAQDQG